MKVTQRYDYEPFEVPLGKKYGLVCCDCGLLHDVVFLMEKKKLYMTAVRRKRIKIKRKNNG